MELRQLRYFVTLAEELHFGRAAERENIVQSALSQQVQRLERELGVRLLERSTHHVSLTAAGVVFLVEARQILSHVDRAAAVARSATGAAAPLRVGIIDSSYDSMPQILHEVQARYPGLVIHQVEASVPGQYQQLIDGRLDVGIGRAALAPPQVASLLFRQDPLGVLVPSGHRFAELDAIPVAILATEPLLLAEEAQAPEFNQFTVEMCRAAGFTPTVYEGTVESIRAAADLVAQGRCLYCVPSSCIAALPGTTWRPLTEPASHYPWSVLWRAAETSGHVHAVVSCARAMSQRLGWLAPAGLSPAGSGRVSHRARPRPAPIPARPTALPRFRFAARRCLRGGLRPGASSPDGGIDEFRELRAIPPAPSAPPAPRPPAPAPRRAPPATRSADLAALVSASRAASSGVTITGHHRRSRPGSPRAGPRRARPSGKSWSGGGSRGCPTRGYGR